MPRKFVDRLESGLRQATDQIADQYVANLAAEAGRYSQVLAESFRTPLQPTPKGFSFRVETPFFWANIIDRGRKAVYANPPKKLAFFANPLEDDPDCAAAITALTTQHQTHGWICRRTSSREPSGKVG